VVGEDGREGPRLSQRECAEDSAEVAVAGAILDQGSDPLSAVAQRGPENGPHAELASRFAELACTEQGVGGRQGEGVVAQRCGVAEQDLGAGNSLQEGVMAVAVERNETVSHRSISRGLDPRRRSRGVSTPNLA